MERRTPYVLLVLRLLIYQQYKHSHGHSEAIKAEVGEGKDIMSVLCESTVIFDHK